MYDLPDKYQGKAIMTAENHLFEVNKTVCKIIKRDDQAFQRIVDKLLFLF